MTLAHLFAALLAPFKTGSGVTSTQNVINHGAQIVVAPSTDLSFTCSGYSNMAGQEVAYARIVKDGVGLLGSNTLVSEINGGSTITSWNLAINYPVTVTVGVATTIKIQWRTYQGTSTLFNNVVSDPDKTCHRTLLIME
jgi:hypothetical protein